ncbi:L-serine ammonia-lyase, iron-sulfur-dependent, subunit alpha [uncultured Sphaerochaeta sp.]|uniref:L-cysteine desulfidase family protein n=1 Tax=uncultured Sphaerochaeta sp. TaxID=886478 RepID=UPI002A0A4060|nr:L-serine ammonia-lyase, iron-sulfur-dependent, subunit alpha [uncultured Sphaerochaeta sp.]
MLVSEDYLQILREELVPALGCTEPIALAFGAAKAREVLDLVPDHIQVACSGNIIKNVKGVVVPNTQGMKGIEAAVAIGMLGGSSKLGLEVLSSVCPEHIGLAKDYLGTHAIEVSLLNSREKLHFVITMSNGDHIAVVEIVRQHTNIVRIEHDGNVVFSKKSEEDITQEIVDKRTFLTIKGILSFSQQVALSQLLPIIEPQIVCNSAICEEGLLHKWGASVGSNILRTLEPTVQTRAKAVSAAGSDARMSGCEMPVVINSGSGNQGIAVSIPVIEFAKAHSIETERLVRALALSNLVAIRQKVKIGRLSAYCGAVSAAIGAGAAITWLSGGSAAQIDETISNTLAIISGMVCDGAKPSCAAKISVAVDAAFLGHSLAMAQDNFIAGEGLVSSNIEDTIDGIGRLASEGMEQTDSVILSLMVKNR